jgi:hypothetical protein
MHPRQANVLTLATELADKTAGKKKQTADKPMPSAPLLWKYETPDGETFYLEVKRTTIKSPFTGKSFSARPIRHTPAQVGKELREEARMASAEDPWKA